MQRLFRVLLVLLVTACSNPGGQGHAPTERDGGIGGTGIVAE